jgi:hypothetical protein
VSGAAVEYLQQLATEWYEYQGYFVHRDLWIGLERDGTYECELDVVAFHPVRRHLVHLETSFDLLDWKEKERHFLLKFDAGRKYLHRLFGAEPRTHLEQIALVVGGDDVPRTIAGGKTERLADVLAAIIAELRSFEIAEAPVPEQWPIMRTLQFLATYGERLAPLLTRSGALPEIGVVADVERPAREDHDVV